MVMTATMEQMANQATVVTTDPMDNQVCVQRKDMMSLQQSSDGIGVVAWLLFDTVIQPVMDH